MPVRPRKRRASRASEIEAWRDVFECKFDFFNDLPDIGVNTDEYGCPDREVTQEAWRRLGAEFMVEWRSIEHRPGQSEPWALLEFGEPPCR